MKSAECVVVDQCDNSGVLERLEFQILALVMCHPWN